MTQVPASTQATPLTPEQWAQAELLVSRAKAKLVTNHPFYASLVLRRPLLLTERIPTACATARGQIMVNPRFILSKEVKELRKVVFLMGHETLHIVFHHCDPDVLGPRNAQAANVAMDKVINEMLIADDVGDFIEGGQRHKGAEQMKWQDLYDEDDSGGPGGIGCDLSTGDPGNPSEPPPSPAEMEQIKAQMRVELAQAAQAAKMQGNLSANAARFVEELLTVTTPWHQKLERFFTGRMNQDYSWKRPNRRFVGRGIYLPSMSPTPSMGPLSVVIDTSGSIGQHELNFFGGHLNRIIETCRPERVVVLYVDSEVCHVDTFEPDEWPVTLKPHGGGGTDMRKGWAWTAKHEPDVDALVLFTDGYTPWPTASEVCVPSIVVSTTDVAAPAHVGETLRFDLEQ
jgi:predicted metal-dependent peptidase